MGVFVRIGISLYSEVVLDFKLKRKLAVSSVLGLSSNTTVFKITDEIV